MSTKIQVAPLCTSRCVRRWLMLRVTTCFLIIHREPVPLHRIATLAIDDDTSVAGDGYMRQWTGSSFNQIMACRRTAPSHYVNQCWIIVYWTFWNKIQSNFHRNSWAQTRPWRGFLWWRSRWKQAVTKHVKFTSFSLNDRSIFPAKICTYATLLSYTINYLD